MFKVLSKYTKFGIIPESQWFFGDFKHQKSCKDYSEFDYFKAQSKYGIGKNRNLETKQLFKFQKIKRKIKKFKEKRK